MTKRSIDLCGDIDSEKIAEIRGKLLKLESESLEPIKVFVDSTGGDLFTSIGLADVILSLKSPIYGYAVGEVASGAFIIFLSCHKRFAYQHAMFMMHRPSVEEMSGTDDEVTTSIKTVRKHFNQAMETLIVGRTSCSIANFKRKITKDWYFDTTTAIKLGFIHGVMPHGED